MVIKQNGPQLVRISDRLNTIAQEFYRTYEQMYSRIDESLGASHEDTKIWYGPRASGCKGLAFRAKPQFETMRRDIQDLANTVNGQAQSWGRQQAAKY